MKKIEFIQLDREELKKLIGEGIQQSLSGIISQEEKNKDTQLLSPKEASDLLKINLSTLYRWTRKGRVCGYAIGGKRYYKKNEILISLKNMNNGK